MIPQYFLKLPIFRLITFAIIFPLAEQELNKPVGAKEDMPMKYRDIRLIDNPDLFNQPPPSGPPPQLGWFHEDYFKLFAKLYKCILFCSAYLCIKFIKNLTISSF